MERQSGSVLVLSLALCLGWTGTAVAQADTTRPALVLVNAYRDTAVLVMFSEPVDVDASTSAASYGLDHGAQINEIIWMSGSRVVLSTSKLTSGVTYTLTVNNVPDLADPPNAIAPNTRRGFSFVRAQSEMPRIVPEGPVYRFSQAVDVSMMHPSAAAEIRYTLDGSDPTSASTKYDGAAVEVTASVTLKARAFEPGLDSSLVASVQFVLDAKGAITYPAGGETFSVGQTVTVRWTSYDSSEFNLAYLWLSVNEGLDWLSIPTGPTGTIAFRDSASFAWTIPASLDDQDLAGTDVMIKVKQYDGPDIATTPVFHIAGDNEVRQSPVQSTGDVRVKFIAGMGAARSLLVTCPGAFRVSLLDPVGRCRAAARGTDAALLRFPVDPPQGCSILLVETADRRLSRLIVVDR